MATVRLSAIAAVLMVVALNHASAASLSDVFSKSDEAAEQSIDHAQWSSLLASYLDGGGRALAVFDYAAVTAADREALKSYIAGLQTITITNRSRDVQMAYWINLYNALTVDVILDKYPVDSIRDIKSGLFSSGPWSIELVTVEGHRLTLDDIEHEILRPIWRDKRIHYVVNCASVGCPNLAGTAYTADNLATMLEQAARNYINSPRGIRVENGSVVASSLYDWYDDDFGSQSEVLGHIRDYASPELLGRLEGKSEIDRYEYDWTLNAPR